jgi:CRP-like cAMP-binding protein
MIPPADIADVATIAVFGGIGAQALQDCADCAVRRTLARGETSFSQGDAPPRFHALLSGSVRVAQSGADGELCVMRFIGPGGLFGSFAIFTDAAYPADALALADSVELSWSAAHIRQLMERHPAIATNLLILAARRLTELQERVREISTQPADQRIANTLLRLARKNGRKLDDGRIEILFPLVRRDVAAISATTLHTASRVMAAWERKSLISSAGKRISLRSIAELSRIGDGA